MNHIPKLLLLMFPVNLAVGLGYQLDVLLGVSLKKGGSCQNKRALICVTHFA